jgi:hypothetical protein
LAQGSGAYTDFAPQRQPFLSGFAVAKSHAPIREGVIQLEAASAPQSRHKSDAAPMLCCITGNPIGRGLGAKLDRGQRRQKGIGMRRWDLIIVTVVMAVICEKTAHAELDLEKVSELARSCIVDHLSACHQYITLSIDDLDNRRKIQGERACFVGHSSDDQIMKTFIHAILTKYAYSDMPSPVAIENIYKDNCADQN